jgi:hypothetical protein
MMDQVSYLPVDHSLPQGRANSGYEMACPIARSKIENPWRIVELRISKKRHRIHNIKQMEEAMREE